MILLNVKKSKFFCATQMLFLIRDTLRNLVSFVCTIKKNVKNTDGGVFKSNTPP